MKPEVVLADIGNTHFHLLRNGVVEHLTHEEAMNTYGTTTLYYISVKHDHLLLKEVPHTWHDIASSVVLQGAYETMGVDRKALCLSHDDGIFVDAGSAITVDVMQAGYYVGGYILPGFKAMLGAYAQISPVLDVCLNKEVPLHTLPTTTKDGISYGIIASIKALIGAHRGDKKLYFTGGDGKFLSTFFQDALYDEKLIFEGMQKAMKDSKSC